METKKEYIVFVTQYCTPIKLLASNKADAQILLLMKFLMQMS